MIDTTEQTTCLACGAPLIQIAGRGHRRRLYCDDTCRQRAHRAKGQQPGGNVTVVTNDDLQQRIAELERQVKDLQASLDIEERFRTDTRKRDFKVWLRTHQQPTDTTFFRRFLADRTMSSEGSRSMYEAKLISHKYSAEDIELFRDAWKRMLFNQS